MRIPGRGLIWAFVGLVALVCLASLRSGDLSDPGSLLNYLGRVTGILGTVLLLLAAALIARIPGVDRAFGGLTSLWRTHHLLGAGALLLLMAHPMLLALGAMDVSWNAAMSTLFPPLSNTGIWLGWTALIMMMIFLAPSFSFFGRPEYQRWKWVHRLSGPAVVLGLLHVFKYGRTLPGWLETALWIGLALMAVGAVIWRLIFARWFGAIRYRIRHVDRVANNLVELRLEPAGRRRIRYRAGQFVYLTPLDRGLAAGHGEEHPYTISSAPEEPEIRIAIKDLGDASRALQSVKPDTPVILEGPYGDFFPDTESGAPELWVAGGIGITPFLGRTRHLAEAGGRADVHLIYCVQDEARARFLEELRELASRISGFELHVHYFYREGPLDEAFVTTCCPDLASRHFYVCGPEPLNRLVRSIARSNGVPGSKIHSEEFELL